MQLVVRKSEPRVWGRKKGGRKKGSINRKHRYLAVITLPDGKKEYIYPEDVQPPKTLHDVVQERSAKHARVENVEYSPNAKVREERAAFVAEGKNLVLRTNKEHADRDKKQFVIDLKQKKKTPHDTPQGDWTSIHTTKEQPKTDASEAGEPVTVDPLTYFAEHILDQINKKKAAQSEPHHLNIPRIDLTGYPPGLRQQIIDKYGDEENLQTELQERPMTTLLTLGLTRTNPKTGTPLLNKKETSQLTSEWYQTIRTTIRNEMPAFRLTEEYNKRRAFDESKGRKVEGRWVPKDRYNRAVAAGEMLGRDDTEKTRTKEMIDSLTAEYMADAFEALQGRALNYKPTSTTKEGKPSRFDRVAYRAIQISVRRHVNEDLRNKYGMREVPHEVQPNIIDIDDRESPPPLKTSLRAPDESVEYGEIAERGRKVFFNHFKQLPEAYQKILALHLQINFAHDEFEDVTGSGEAHAERAGARSFTDIAQANPVWQVPAFNFATQKYEGTKEVDLRNMSEQAQLMFLVRLEQSARNALRATFAPKGASAEESSAQVPLSKKGKLAFRWLKLQAKLAERAVPTPAEHSPGTVVQGKFKTKRNAEHKTTRFKLTEHPNAPGVRFFVQKQEELSKLRSRDLETAIALRTAPGPLPAKPGKILTKEQRNRFARMEKLYSRLGVEKQVKELEGQTGELNVVPPTKQRMAMRYLNRLYQAYQKTTKVPSPVVEKRLKALLKLRKQIDTGNHNLGEPHEVETHRRRVEELILIHKYILNERAAVGKSLTLAHFDDVMDEWDFQLGRARALA